METYYTEGMVKSIKLDGNKPRIEFEPVSPYKFTEKKDGKDISSIMFIKDEPQTARPIAVFNQTSKAPGVFTDFGEVADGEVPVDTALSLLCETKRGHRVFTLQSRQLDNPFCRSAVLLKDDILFSVESRLAQTIDFAALLALKQNRTKIRIWTSCEPKVSSLVEITNVKICE